MNPRSLTRLALIALLGLAPAGLLACSETESAEVEVDLSVHEIDGEGCAACGMIVREQPAPRGQVIHRDGTREFFCSIADMITYLNAPSPHGQARAIYVETLTPDADPSEHAHQAHPWSVANDARYVLGVSRDLIMGEPVLVYANEADAQSAAAAHEGRVVDYEALVQALAQ